MYNPGQELSSLSFDKIIGGALDAVVNAQNNSAMTTVSFVKAVGFTKINEDKETPVYVDFKYPKEIAPYIPASTTASIKIVDGKGGTEYVKDQVDVYIDERLITANVQIDEGVIKGVTLVDNSEWDGFTDESTVKFIRKDLDPDSADKQGADNAEAKVKVVAKAAVPAQYQDMTLQVPILTMMPIPFIRIDSCDIEFNVKINSINSTQTESSSSTNVNSSTTAKFGKFFSPVTASTTINASYASQKKSSSSEEIKKEYALNIKVHAAQSEMPAGMSRILDILEESIISKPSNLLN